MSDIVSKFIDRHGFAPDAAAEAPGRLEILGNHTDYNQGFVLSCAVEQTTRIALKKIPGTLCRVYDLRDGSEMQFDLADLDAPPPRNGSRYIKGMVKSLVKRNFKVGAFDAVLESSVPLSAGMSSSAALEIAAGLALGRAFGIELDGKTWALCGQEVENRYLGLNSGLLDQFSSVFGKRDCMILSDFRTNTVLRQVPMPTGYAVVVINSMQKHNLVDSEYNVRRQDCEEAARVLHQTYPEIKTLRDATLEQLESVKGKMAQRAWRRALHVVGECVRVKAAVAALDAGDIAAFGQLWFESHESSRVNFENSTPELDYLVEIAHNVPGGLGARLSGGGFGGITVHLVEQDRAEEYAGRVAEAYRLRTGIAAESIICRIGDGARVIEF